MKFRFVPMIALWLVVLGLWAFVLLRSPQSAGTPRLPALGPTPGVTVHPGSTPSPSPTPGTLQAGPVGPVGPVGAASGSARAGNTADAEDLAEGDVEDDAPKPTASGSAGGVGVAVVIPAVPLLATPTVHLVGNAPVVPALH